jgi:hypothetical protein
MQQHSTFYIPVIRHVNVIRFILTRMETIINVIFNLASNYGLKLLLSRYLFVIMREHIFIFEPYSAVLTKHFRYKLENCIKHGNIDVFYDRSGLGDGCTFSMVLCNNRKNTQHC